MGNIISDDVKVWFTRKFYIPGIRRYDSTAMGVAKMRLMSSLDHEDKRIIYDPYAKDFVIGSFLIELIKPEVLRKISDQQMPGLYTMVLGRTRFLDELCKDAIQNHGCIQVIILGAGYDTRGIRLRIDKKVPFYEVDQPEMHILKKAWFDELKEDDDVKEQKSLLHLISVDFNTESLSKLGNHPDFQMGVKTLVLLEGVTQYIPKESVAETLRGLRLLLGSGSILGVSYVNEAIFDDNKETVEREIGITKDKAVKLLHMVKLASEPWISSWTKISFANFLSEYSFKVEEDICIDDLEEKYFKPLGVTASPFCRAERFVRAVYT